MKPTIVIIGADKGGVGKTTTARCLLDYIAFKNISCNMRVFDTEYPRGTLNRFYEKAQVVDLENIRNQMTIIDNSANNLSIVDVCAGLLSPTLKIFNDIGILDAVKQGEIKMVLLHVLGPSISSLSEIAETVKLLNNVSYFLVQNHVNGTDFFAWDKDISGALNLAPVIDIPQLNEHACEYVDKAGGSFKSFIDNTGNSFVLRGTVKHWLANVCAEFDRVKMGNIINAPTE